jgi:hypothetical protein
MHHFIGAAASRWATMRVLVLEAPLLAALPRPHPPMILRRTGARRAREGVRRSCVPARSPQ